MNIDEGLARAIDDRDKMDKTQFESIKGEVPQLDVVMNDISTLREEEMRNFAHFSDTGTRKIFCACGAIAELDSSVISLKRRLSKEIECSRCRNKRIAEEQKELRKIYSEEEEGWLYG